MLGQGVILPGKGNSNSHGARPVHLIITMIKWTRTSRLSIKKSLSGQGDGYEEEDDAEMDDATQVSPKP